MIKKLVSVALCCVLAFSLCNTTVQAVVPKGGAESGSTYLVRPNSWSPCAAFSAEKTGVAFTLSANDPSVANYKVQLCIGKLGTGTAVDGCDDVPIGTTVTFSGLNVGEEYYFTVSSDTVTGNGVGAIYTLSNFDTQYGSSYADGHGVRFYYNNGSNISVGVYINVKGQFFMIDAPVYAGHTFAGWSNGGKIYQPGDMVNVVQDMRFDATWVESTPARNPFTDIHQGDTYFDAVMYVYEKGIMEGTSAMTFSPNDPVTRAAVWTVLARMSGVDTSGGNTWYEKAQKWAISTGISDGNNPEQIVSHQEFITMLYRYAGSPPVKNPENYATAFGDMKDVAGWAYNSVIWATQNDLLNIYYSSGMLCPAQVSLRWELACVLAQYDMKVA